MDCPTAQEWLLNADDPRSPACPDAQIAAHLASCPICQAFAQNLLKLEADWRGMRFPAADPQTRAAFLRRLPSGQPAKKILRRSSWRLVLAAVLLVAAGVLVWCVFFRPPEISAKEEVVTRLLDWNLELAQSNQVEERARIYQAQAESLQRDVSQARLAPEDDQLARQLLSHGRWLSANADPLAEAERFSQVADLLAQRVETAAKGGDERKIDRAGTQYELVTQVVRTSLRRAEPASVQAKLLKLCEREATRNAKLSDLTNRLSPSAQRALRSALAGQGKALKKVKKVP